LIGIFYLYILNTSSVLYITSKYIKLNWCDLHQYRVAERYTSLMVINRNLSFLPNYNITHHMMSTYST